MSLLARELILPGTEMTMVSTRITAGIVLLGALAAAPVFADDGGRRRGDDRRGGRSEERTARRAVPRSPGAVRHESYRHDGRRRDGWRNDQRRNDHRRYDYRRHDRRDDHLRYDYRRYDDRRYDYRRYDDRRYYRHYPGRRIYVRPHRIIRPRIVTVVPYRPYYYRPSFSIGVYYGTGGAYPYGYVPRAYYDPIPGRPYGGVRITDAPRDARVFADGSYVGIVDDFDGVFQHVNLEAGEHRIEIQIPGYDTIGYDVMVQPGRTITLRADTY
jgi:hypothetical protein